MIRRRRRFAPNIPVHLVLYGFNHSSCFFTEEDYRFFLYRLAGMLNRYQVKLHAYVLMPNHIHLLLSSSDENGIDDLMHVQKQHYQQYVNRTYKRSGQVWQSNYKACQIDADDYLLRLYHYIELKPVRVGMVDHPEEYTWSSYRLHAFNEMNPLIQDNPVFHLLSEDVETRNNLYQEMSQIILAETDISAIENAYQYEIPLGDQYFKLMIEESLEQQLNSSLDELSIQNEAS